MIKMSRPTKINLWTVVCGGDSERAGNMNPEDIPAHATVWEILVY